MNDKLISQAPIQSMKNRLAIEFTERCSCYSCMAVFAKEDIKEWTDQSTTALCPRCGVDSVLPQNYEIEELRNIHNYWFGNDQAS